MLMMEFMIPYYASAALSEYNRSGAVRDAILGSKTIDKKRMTPEVKQFLATNTLKYELDLYNFAKNVFIQRLVKSGAVNPDWYKDEEGIENRFIFRKENGDYPKDPEFLRKYVPLKLHRDMTVEYYKYHTNNETGQVYHSKMEELLDKDAHKPPPTPKPLPPWANPDEVMAQEATILKQQQEQLLQQISIMEQLQAQQEQMEQQRIEVAKKNDELAVQRKADIAKKLEEKHIQEEEQRKLDALQAKKDFDLKQAMNAGWGAAVGDEAGSETTHKTGRHGL